MTAALLALIACGGPGAAGSPAPTPATDPAWLDAAVAEALAWEVMPGTEGEPDDGTRAAALRAFFAAHPEYADPVRREALAAHACGLGGTEQAHAYLAAPPPREALVVEVTGDAWEVLVAHADHACTSDDWTWYTNDTAEAATARGAVTGYAGHAHDAVVVRRDGAEVARIPVSGQGFLMAKAGAPPQDLGYAPTPELLGALDAYLGPPAP